MVRCIVPPYAFIGGGRSNTLNGGDNCAIVGGFTNSIYSNTTQSVIIGGANNVINPSLTNVVMLGTNARTAMQSNTTYTEAIVANGSITTSILTISSNTTLDASHSTILIPVNSAFSITLPQASSAKGRTYRIVNKSGSLKTIGDYLNLSDTLVSTIPTATSLELQSDGVNWQQIR